MVAKAVVVGAHIITFLSTLAILPYLSFLCFNLGKIVCVCVCVCVMLRFQYKISDEDTEHYLT